MRATDPEVSVGRPTFRFRTAITGVFGFFDRADHRGILFWSLLAVLALWLLPLDWRGNEDYYFLLADRYIDRNPLSEASAVLDHTNARFLFNIVLGSLIELLGYDGAHVAARAGLALGFAWAFTLLALALRLSALDIVAAVGAAELMGPDLLGGEWIFRAAESKTFAYIFVVASLAFVLRGKTWASVVCALLATYFHFLVGGFWTAAFVILHYDLHRSLRSTARFAAIYALLVLPLFVVILKDQGASFGATSLRSEDGLTAEYIYSVVRNPHHVAPYVDTGAWIGGVTKAIAVLLVLAGLLLFAPSHLRPVIRLLCGICFYLFFALVISFVDKETAFLGKFYLFRPSALTLLLTLVVCTLVLREALRTDQQWLRWIAFAPVFILFFAFLARYDLIHIQHDDLAPVVRVAAEIRTLTEEDDVILIQSDRAIGGESVTFPRVLERPTLVNWKYVPTNSADIIEWYNRTLFAERLFAGNCQRPLAYPVDYLLVLTASSAEKVSHCGSVVWTDGAKTLFRLAAAAPESETRE